MLVSYWLSISPLSVTVSSQVGEGGWLNICVLLRRQRTQPQSAEGVLYRWEETARARGAQKEEQALHFTLLFPYRPPLRRPICNPLHVNRSRHTRGRGREWQGNTHIADGGPREAGFLRRGEPRRPQRGAVFLSRPIDLFFPIEGLFR